MKEYINPNILPDHYELPKKISITNQEYIWLAFHDYANGSITPKKEKEINNFFLKIGVLVIMKTFPTIPSSFDSDLVDSSTNNLFQKDKLHDIYIGLIDYYMTRVKSHILKKFPSRPISPSEKRIFVSYFLTKASQLLSSVIRKDSKLESREISSDIEWIAMNASPIAKKAQELEEKEREKREIERQKMQDERTPMEILKGVKKEPAKPKPKPRIDIHPQMPTPEERVIQEAEEDEWIESLTKRQRDGKKNRQRIEDIYKRREWEKKQLVSFWGAIAQLESKKLLEDYFDDNHEFLLDSLILPIEDKLLIVPKFLENEHLDTMWKIYLSGKLPKKPEISDEDRNAIEAIRRKG